jgi:hypothetical protein
MLESKIIITIKTHRRYKAGTNVTSRFQVKKKNSRHWVEKRCKWTCNITTYNMKKSHRRRCSRIMHIRTNYIRRRCLPCAELAWWSSNMNRWSGTTRTCGAGRGASLASQTLIVHWKTTIISHIVLILVQRKAGGNLLALNGSSICTNAFSQQIQVKYEGIHSVAYINWTGWPISRPISKNFKIRD